MPQILALKELRGQIMETLLPNNINSIDKAFLIFELVAYSLQNHDEKMDDVLDACLTHTGEINRANGILKFSNKEVHATSLNRGIQAGNLYIVKYLLEHGADTSSHPYKGYPVRASYCNSLTYAESLVDNEKSDRAKIRDLVALYFTP